MPDILPLPRPDPRPRVWFGRLYDAVKDGDHEREQEARRELAALGFQVRVSPQWRRKAVRV